jgi:hypothetical protein
LQLAHDGKEMVARTEELPDSGKLPTLELVPEMRVDPQRQPAAEPGQAAIAPAVVPAPPLAPVPPSSTAPTLKSTSSPIAEPARDAAREPLRDSVRDPAPEPTRESDAERREPARPRLRDVLREGTPQRRPGRDSPRNPSSQAPSMPRESPAQPPPLPSPALATPAIEPQQQPAARRREAQIYRLRSPWLAVLSLAILVIGAVAGGLMAWQLNLLQTQVTALQSSVVQNGQVAGATQRLADAATQANEIANQALVTTTRPWVGVETVEAGPIQSNLPLNIEVRVRNSGRTPSDDVQGLFLVYISPIDAPPALLSDPCTSCVRSVVLPNGVVTYKLSVRENVMTPDEVQRIKEGRDTMWIVGRLDYHDAEGEGHTTRSCLFYRTSGLVAFSACSDGNSAN